MNLLHRTLKPMLPFMGLLLVLALVFVPHSSVQAATFNVNNQATLAAAIITANGTPAVPDTINLTANIEMTDILDGTDGLNGLPSITSPITINGNGHELSRSTSEGIDQFRLLHVSASGSLTLQNISLTRGNSIFAGGAVYNAGTLTLTSPTFSFNSTQDMTGGAIYNSGTVTGAANFTSNTASISGGAIQNTGSLTLTGGTFSQNGSALGGAIASVGGTMSLSGLTFMGNTSGVQGGAVYVSPPEVAVTADPPAITISGVTFTNNKSNGQGGAIFASWDMNIDTSTFTGNNALIGGGIFNDHLTTINITGGSFNSNTAQVGAGIANFATLITNNVNFTGNIGNTAGGAISNSLVDGQGVTINGGTFSQNHSGGAGGAISNGDSLTINGATFAGNSADEGGAIANLSIQTAADNPLNPFPGTPFTNIGVIDIKNTTFKNNQASDHGAAIFSGDSLGASSIVTATNSTFSGNTGPTFGGGISNVVGTMSLINVTMIGNGANNGGGIYNFNGTLNISNSIVANSASGSNCVTSGGTFNATNGNLSSDNSCPGFTQPGTNPMVGALASNAPGSTETHALLEGSPAVNMALNCTVNTDQRGVARPVGGACDLGAYESPYTSSNEEGSINVTLASNTPSLPEPGGTVQLTLGIQNTGPIPVIVGSQGGMLDGQGNCDFPQTIQPNNNYGCSFPFDIPQSGTGNAGDLFRVQFSVVGVDDNQNTVEDTAFVDISITDVPSSIALGVVANPTSVPEPGGNVNYTLTIENTSTVDVLTVNSLTSDLFGNLNGQGTCTTGFNLNPGDDTSCTFTGAVSGNTPGTAVTANFTVGASDNDQGTPSNTASAAVNITNVASSMTVGLTANPTSIDEPGGNISYNLTVTNTSAVDDITINGLTSNLFGSIAGKGNCATGSTLAPSAQYTCTFSGGIAGSGGDTITNTVTVNATDSDSVALEEAASADVDLNVVQTNLSITVGYSAAPPSVSEAGDNVTFTASVTNNSPVNVTVTGLNTASFGDLNGQGDCVTGASLVSGASYSCSFVAFVSGSGGTTLSDTLTVSVASTSDSASGIASTSVSIVDTPSGIALFASADPNNVDEPGGGVGFLLTVVNNSTVDTILITSLNSDQFGSLNGQGNCATGMSLLPNESYNCSFGTNVSGNGGDVLSFGFSVAATDDDSNPIGANASATVNINEVDDPNNPPEPPECTDPNPARDLKHTQSHLTSDSTGVIVNLSAACSYEVGMASYKMPTNIIDDQVLFSSDTRTIGPNQTLNFSVSLPGCGAQVDLFYGGLLPNLQGKRYGERLIDGRFLEWGNWCDLGNNDEAGVTPPTETPSDEDPTGGETEPAGETGGDE